MDKKIETMLSELINIQREIANQTRALPEMLAYMKKVNPEAFDHAEQSAAP